MERRYLVAALAIIATFTVFSRGMRTLERASLSYGRSLEAQAHAKCDADASAASRWVSKVRSHLRPGYAEEAQLLAEMNLPIAMVQARMAEQVARQNMEAVQCARERALREAERAQRQAERMRDKMARANANAAALPIAWRADAGRVFSQRMQVKAAEIAKRVAAQAAQNVHLQMAVENVVSLKIPDPEVVSVKVVQESDSPDTEDADSSVHCNAATQSRRTTHTRAKVHEIDHANGYR